MDQFFEWLGEIIASFFPWPFLILVVLLWMLGSKEAKDIVRNLLNRLKKVKVGDLAEIELGDETRKEFTHKAAELQEFIGAYRPIILKEVNRLIDFKDVEQLLQRLVEDHIVPSLPDQKVPKDFRCTIHTKDFLFKDRLIQLLPYYPSSTGGSGRTFSIRYGVIGKAFRSTMPQIKGKFLSYQSGEKIDQTKLLQDIALNWGLTIGEARNVMNYPSYCAVPLWHESKLIGVFYMDSTEEMAFSRVDDDEALVTSIRDGAEQTGLSHNVAEIIEQLGSSSARIEIE